MREKSSSVVETDASKASPFAKRRKELMSTFVVSSLPSSCRLRRYIDQPVDKKKTDKPTTMFGDRDIVTSEDADMGGTVRDNRGGEESPFQKHAI